MMVTNFNGLEWKTKHLHKYGRVLLKVYFSIEIDQMKGFWLFEIDHH